MRDTLFLAFALAGLCGCKGTNGPVLTPNPDLSVLPGTDGGQRPDLMQSVQDLSVMPGSDMANSSGSDMMAVGKSCKTANDCGLDSWCMGTTQSCPGTPGAFFEGSGTCHALSTNGMCNETADCGPGCGCGANHQCLCTGGCPPPALCNWPGCSMVQPGDVTCPTCVCTMCPAQPKAQTGIQCGHAGVCPQDQFCVNGYICEPNAPCLSDPTCACFKGQMSMSLECVSSTTCSIDSSGIIYCM